MLDEIDEIKINEIYDNMNKVYDQKKEKLRQIIENYTSEDIIVALTGGVGSSLLLKLVQDAATMDYGKVYAITIRMPLKPVNDIAIARKVAKELGAKHSVISIDDPLSETFMENPVNRCYLCKRCIFDKLKNLAEDLDVPVILEGTNYEDAGDSRPGNQAIRELGIKSPLAEAGFTREEVVHLARELGISVADKPNSPCLATRFPYHTQLDLEVIRNVEQSEEYIKSLGIANVRVRVHGSVARIEIDPDDFQKLLQHKEDVTKYLRNHGFLYVTMDLCGFSSGSMDLELQKEG